MNYTNLFFTCRKDSTEEAQVNMLLFIQNLPTCYMWKNMRQQYKNKLIIIASTLNDEFELRDGSYSVLDIQDYTKYIIKKHDTLSTNSPIHVYINKINIQTSIQNKRWI